MLCYAQYRTNATQFCEKQYPYEFIFNHNSGQLKCVFNNFFYVLKNFKIVQI